MNRSQFKIRRFELLAYVQIQTQRTSAQTPRLHVLEKSTLTLGVLGRLTPPRGSKAKEDGTLSSLLGSGGLTGPAGGLTDVTLAV